MAVSQLTGPALALDAPGLSSARHSSALIAVGSRAYSQDGEYVFIKAIATIPINTPVGTITDLSNCQAGDLGVAEYVGVADAAFASGEWGYVRVRGPAGVVVESGASAGEFLELSATVSTLKTLTTSGVAVARLEEDSDDAGAAAVACQLIGGF